MSVTDQQALQAVSASLADDHGYGNVEVVGLVGVALLATNYGVMGVPPQEVQTNNWLGLSYGAKLGQCLPGDVMDRRTGTCLRMFTSPEAGAKAALDFVSKTPSFAEALSTGDVGKLAWELMKLKIVGAPLTLEAWEIVKLGLGVSLGRIEDTIHHDDLWNASDWMPPVDSGKPGQKMSDKEAYQALITQMSPAARGNATEVLGLLAWAAVGSDYGFARGQQTYNWSSEGRDPGLGGCPASSVLDDLGKWCLTRYPDAKTGVQSFLMKMDGQTATGSGDIGLLTLAMFDARAWGFEAKLTKDAFWQVAATLTKAVDRISKAVGLGSIWKMKTAPPEYVKKEMEKPVHPDMETGAFPWKWVLGAVAVAGAGAGGYYVWKRARTKELENQRPKSATGAAPAALANPVKVPPKALPPAVVDLDEEEDEEDEDVEVIDAEYEVVEED